MPGEQRRCAADLHAAGLRAGRGAHQQQQLLHNDLQVVHAAELRARRRAPLRANPSSNPRPNPNPIPNPNPNPNPHPNPNQATRTTTGKATRNKATRKATRSRDTRSGVTRSGVTPRVLFAWLLGRRPAPGQQQRQQQHRRLRRQQEQQQQRQRSGRRRVAAGTRASASKVHRRLLLAREAVSASVERSQGALYTPNVGDNVCARNRSRAYNSCTCGRCVHSTAQSQKT